MAILFLHHTKSDVTLHHYNLLKKHNPNSNVFPVGFAWHNLMEGSHIVYRYDEYPNNYILNNILNMGTSSESDLCIYDFFIHHQNFDSYFVVEWDTYCNCSVEEYYGEAMKKYDTFSANIFTNVKESSEIIIDKNFDMCAICENITNTKIGTNVKLRNNYIDGVGQLCFKCYTTVDKTKYIQTKPHRQYVKEWSWYRQFFSQLNEPTKQKKLLPYLGGTYPTSLLYYTHQVLYDMMELILKNTGLYDNIQNEMRLGTLLQQAGYRLEMYGRETNQFCEQPHYHTDIINNIKGYYHPIKTIY